MRVTDRSGSLGPPPQTSGATGPSAPTPTAEETLTRWTQGMLPSVLADTEHLQRLFEELARGALSQAGADAAADGFFQLIRLEKFDLFVELFNLCQDILRRQAAARGDAEPHRSAMDICQPPDWNPDPGLLDKMLGAFRRVQVDTLRIVSAHEDAMASPAMSRCVQAFLEGGTTCLIIDTALDAPHGVAEALAQGALTSIELGAAYGQTGSPPQPHLDSHRVLLCALARSHTLQTISLGHAALTALHGAFTHFDARHGAPLKTLSLRAHPHEASAPGNTDDQTAFMGAIRAMASVENVQVDTGAIDLSYFRHVYLAPLSGHEQLARLDLRCDRGSRIAWDTGFLPVVAALASTCPSLTHFHASVDTHPHPLLDRLNACVQRGEDIDPIAAVQALNRTLEGKVLPLQSLRLSGFYLSAGILKALLAMLAPDGPLRSLRHLDLSGCLLDLRTTLVDGMAALANSRSLETVQLPQPQGYGITDLDGELHGFAGIGYWNETGPAEPFQPIRRAGSHPDNLQAVAAILASLRDAASTFLRAPQQTLDLYRGQRLAHAALGPWLDAAPLPRNARNGPNAPAA